MLMSYYVTYTDTPCIECNKCTHYCEIVYDVDEGCKIDMEFCLVENKEKILEAARNCPQNRIRVINE